MVGGTTAGSIASTAAVAPAPTIITTPATVITGGVIVTAPVNTGRGINERTQCAVSMITASGLPPNCRPVKTSTVVTFSRMGSPRVPQKWSLVLR
jgi:hypothetical protein